MLLLWLDLAGLAVFAASGAFGAVRARLDVFGVVVLGVTTALGGGIVRDLLLGIHPPTTLRDWRYLAVPAVTALAVFVLHPQLARVRRAVLLADAAGLGLFTVAGTGVALAHSVPLYTACLIGMINGIGGGVLRDLLLREIPMVLRREIYALAALVGAVVVVLGARWHLPADAVAPVAVATVVTIRVVALWRHWNAPQAKGVDGS